MNNLRNLFGSNPSAVLGFSIGLVVGLILGISMRNAIIGFGSFLSIGFGITILLNSNNQP